MKICFSLEHHRLHLLMPLTMSFNFAFVMLLLLIAIVICLGEYECGHACDIAKVCRFKIALGHWSCPSDVGPRNGTCGGSVYTH